MVVEVFAADARASMGVGVVAPAEDAGLRDIVWQEIAEPVDAVACSPGLFAVAVETMHGDDTVREKRLAKAMRLAMQSVIRAECR